MKTQNNEVPSMSEAANGWWWLWQDEEWCAAVLEYDAGLFGDPSLRIKWLRAKGGMSSYYLKKVEIGSQVWGGRIVTPTFTPSLATP